MDKSFGTSFSNVYTSRNKTRLLLNKLDGKVLEALDKVGSSGSFPITEAKIRRYLSKKVLAALEGHGGLKGSIKRLEEVGVIYRDRDMGWKID